MRRRSLAWLVAALLLSRGARADEPAPTPTQPPPDAPAAAPAEAPPAAPAPIEVPPPPPAPTAVEVVGPPGLCGTRCAPACWWTIEVQGHVGLLTPGPEGPVSLDIGSPNAVVWDPIEYGIAGGGRVEVSHPVGSWILNAGGTFWGQWQDTAVTSGTFGVGAPPQESPPYTNVGLTAEATLWGVDVSLLKTRCVSPCLFTGWGLGLRGMSFQEEGDLAVPLPTSGTLGSAHMEADNCLLAAQVVGQVQWKLSSSWDLRLRGAGFVGWLHEETEVTSAGLVDAGSQVPQSSEEDGVGFGGELEVSLGWCVRRGWTLRAGYGLLALADVTRLDQVADFSNALGTDVIGATQGDDLLLAHRFFVGLSIDL